MRIFAFGCCLALAMPMAGCGLSPMYQGGAQGIVAQQLASVQIPEIEGRAGWLLRHELQRQFDPTGQGATGGQKYRLDIVLDDRLEGIGIVEDDIVTRERRTLSARYNLVDLSSGEVIFTQTARSNAGIDVTSSEYATIAAEDRALENLVDAVADQISLRLSRFAQEQSKAAEGE